MAASASFVQVLDRGACRSHNEFRSQRQMLTFTFVGASSGLLACAPSPWIAVAAATALLWSMFSLSNFTHSPFALGTSEKYSTWSATSCVRLSTCKKTVQLPGAAKLQLLSFSSLEGPRLHRLALKQFEEYHSGSGAGEDLLLAELGTAVHALLPS